MLKPMIFLTFLTLFSVKIPAWIHFNVINVRNAFKVMIANELLG